MLIINQAPKPDTNYDNQLSAPHAKKNSRDQDIEKAKQVEGSETKDLYATTLQLNVLRRPLSRNSDPDFLQDWKDQSNDDYSGIPLDVIQPQRNQQSDAQIIQRVRKSIISPEAEAASNAATLILIFIALMGNFQKAKMNEIVSNLKFILDKISDRIAAMEIERDTAFGRDLANSIGELVLNTISLGVSIASLAKIAPLRGQLITEQEDLVKVYEYETLKANPSLNQTKMQQIQEHFNPNDPTSTQIPRAEAVKANIELYQTQIARFEAAGQLANSVGALLKGVSGAVAASFNMVATNAKIDEWKADAIKEIYNNALRLALEFLSVYRETYAKLISQEEQMLDVTTQNSKAFTKNMT